jgi:hypothetical protein
MYALRKTSWPKIVLMDEDVDNDNNSTKFIRCSSCWDAHSFSQALFYLGTLDVPSCSE